MIRYLIILFIALTLDARTPKRKKQPQCANLNMKCNFGPLTCKTYSTPAGPRCICTCEHVK